jgi:SAM-dependent methyltransferase
VTVPSAGAAPTAAPGSFRDPRARVYDDGSTIRRGLSERGLADLRAVEASGLLAELVREGRVVGTHRVDDPELAALGWAGALVHDRIPIVTYPYEWTFSMLRDAALLQLAIVRRGLARGISCKDGTPYNVQFVGPRPVFIDVGSFEPTGADAWPGYRQFCQLYLYPLMVEAYLGVSFAPLLRGSIDGITPEQADRLLRGRVRARRGVLAHVTLQAFAARRYADRTDPAEAVAADGEHVRIVGGLVARLESLIGGLPAPADPTVWSDYGDRSHYTSVALRAKDAFVARAVDAVAPGVVVDLGCNDGRFARAAAERGATVLALDADRLVVDRLYRQLRGTCRVGGSVLPAVVDLADPSPSLGWDLAERPALDHRVDPDLVLALALVHHLVIGRNIPVPAFLDSLGRLGRHVVLEVPHRADPKVQQLLAAKPADTHLDYDDELVRAAIEARFEVVATEGLPGGTRTLHHLRSR